MDLWSTLICICWLLYFPLWYYRQVGDLVLIPHPLGCFFFKKNRALFSDLSSFFRAQIFFSHHQFTLSPTNFLTLPSPVVRQHRIHEAADSNSSGVCYCCRCFRSSSVMFLTMCESVGFGWRKNKSGMRNMYILKNEKGSVHRRFSLCIKNSIFSGTKKISSHNFLLSLCNCDGPMVFCEIFFLNFSQTITTSIGNLE